MIKALVGLTWQLSHSEVVLFAVPSHTERRQHGQHSILTWQKRGLCKGQVALCICCLEVGAGWKCGVYCYHSVYDSPIT